MIKSSVVLIFLLIIEMYSPIRLFNSVDLPALVFPIILVLSIFFHLFF